MAEAIIKVENVSKKFVISHEGRERYTSLRDVLSRNVKRALKIGERPTRGATSQEDFWALRDLSFEIKQGDRVGIIGRNGAGKSTLLKVLSRITEPTSGRIEINGRVASLLEVGTGFHPELTGRENIFLNGAILGMSRAEIRQKFDEIVAFAEVEQFLDTPVKRYSSGMYVRLAFAVAAHLEPEILIVDEVLAVGDAQFQKKCLGKMQDVSNNEGRTVLFVSHNMTAIKNLCQIGLYMNKGTLLEMGPMSDVVNNYLSNYVNKSLVLEFDNEEAAPGNAQVKLKRIAVVPVVDEPTDPIVVSTPINIEFEFWNHVTDKNINLSLHLFSISQECIFNVGTQQLKLNEGLHKGVCNIPGHLLNDGIYSVSMMVIAEGSYSLYEIDHAVSFEVTENRENFGWHGKWPGFVRPNLNFTLH